MSFNKKYFIAVSVIILLLICNQVIIQYWLHQKQNDANIINVSGKQRMLSQKIMSLFYDFQIHKNPKSKLELKNTLNEWSSVHNTLLIQDYKISDKTVNLNLSLIALTKKVDTAYLYFDKIESLIADDLNVLKANQNTFLVKMDYIVSQLEQHSHNHLNQIIRIELTLAIISFFIILFEVIFIFRPMILELLKRNKALENNNKILEEYAYIASHDLRTPIRSIHSFLTLLLRSAKSKLNNQELEYAKNIKESALRMNETTKDLLAYSVSNKLNRKVVNINHLLADLIDDLNITIEATNTQIIIENMPKSIHIDKDLFRLLLQNLITNGIKFTPKDKTPKIIIYSQETKSNYQFNIKDNGIGIPQKDHETVFKIFKRLHSSAEYQGTGIGLALCKRIVEGHNGTIWVESEEGNGSTFKFSIPKLKQHLN